MLPALHAADPGKLSPRIFQTSHRQVKQEEQESQITELIQDLPGHPGKVLGHESTPVLEQTTEDVLG